MRVGVAVVLALLSLPLLPSATAHHARLEAETGTLNEACDGEILTSAVRMRGSFCSIHMEAVSIDPLVTWTITYRFLEAGCGYFDVLWDGYWPVLGYTQTAPWCSSGPAEFTHQFDNALPAVGFTVHWNPLPRHGPPAIEIDYFSGNGASDLEPDL